MFQHKLCVFCRELNQQLRDRCAINSVGNFKAALLFAKCDLKTKHTQHTHAFTQHAHVYTNAHTFRKQTNVVLNAELQRLKRINASLLERVASKEMGVGGVTKRGEAVSMGALRYCTLLDAC